MEAILFKSAFGLYAGAAAAACAYLARKKERLSLWMRRLIGVGLAVHGASFLFRTRAFWEIPENRYFLPINTFFGALSYLALALAAIFFIVEGRHRLGVLGAFVLPLVLVTQGSALFAADPSIAGLVPALQSYWINIHPMVLMTSYALLANSFGVGLALLLQERQIKSRRPSELCYRLPALEELDDLSYRLIAVAFPILTVGIIMGGVWAYGAWGRFWGWDAKETWALITALIYAVYLHMRFISGWRGRKAVYLSMVGFASVIFTFAGVNYLSGLHGYLSGGN